MMQPQTVDMTQISSRFNRFQFEDIAGTTRIVFLTQAPGPARIDDPPNASQLEYHGPEGSFIFRGNDIEKEASRLGRLVTVTLRTNAADAGQLDFTLVFPALRVGNEKQLKFETIAVKSLGLGFVPSNFTGPEVTYEVLNLVAVADSIIIPF